MTSRNIYSSRALAIAVLVGIPILLFLGAIYNILPPRGWAIGMIAWVAVLLLWAASRKRTLTEGLMPGAENGTIFDDAVRERISRRILMCKIWIGFLAVGLALGIANGIAHRYLIPTLGGVVISVVLTYLAMREISHERKRLNNSDRE